MNNRMNDNTHLLFELVRKYPKYKTRSSHVVPTCVFEPDPIMSLKNEKFVPFEIKQIGTQNKTS